jgi:hypothetical protein
LATDGAGIVITGNLNDPNFGRSTDHGATWSDQIAPLNINQTTITPSVIHIGGNFYFFRESGNDVCYSPSALTGSFVVPGAVYIFGAASADSYGVNGTNVFYTGVGLRKFTLTIPTAFAGMDVAAAILEVTP